MGLHVSDIIQGYSKAGDKALSILSGRFSILHPIEGIFILTTLKIWYWAKWKMLEMKLNLEKH